MSIGEPMAKSTIKIHEDRTASAAFESALGALRSCHLGLVEECQREVAELRQEVLRLRNMNATFDGVKDDTSQADYQDPVPHERTETPETGIGTHVVHGGAVEFEDDDLLLALDRSSDQVLQCTPTSRTSVRQSSERSLFELRADWDGADDVCPEPTKRVSRVDLLALTTSYASQLKVESRRCVNTSVIRPPASLHKVIWDMIGGILIAYDLITVPLTVFRPDSEADEVSQVLDWCCLLFWTLDMPMSLTVGYVKNGKTILNAKRVLGNYVTKMLLADLLIVVPDWIFTVVISSQAGTTIRLIRIMRLVRVVRLVRVFKLTWLLESFEDMMSSESSGIIFKILRMIMTLILINHLIACAWYMVSDMTGEDGNSESSWIRQLSLHSESLGTQYITCFHWSITQFTPASKPLIQPQNTGERAFAVSVVVFALVVFAFIVGGITSGLAQLRSLSEERSKEFWKLRRYLRQNAVPMTLSVRIQRYLEHTFDRQRAGISSKSVNVLSLLSRPLHEEMQHAIRMPIMSYHPLFEHLNSEARMVAMHVAGDSLTCRYLGHDDVLFVQEEPAKHMYFIRRGQLLYTYTSLFGEPQKSLNDVDDWISEPALWTDNWKHHGRLQAVHSANLLALDAGSFAAVVCKVRSAARLISYYAREYIGWLNTQNEDMLDDLASGSDEATVARMTGFLEQRDSTADGDGTGSSGLGSSSMILDMFGARKRSKEQIARGQQNGDVGQGAAFNRVRS